MLKRDIKMRPPRGWTKYIDEVWKLLKPAYGLVESERLRQLCIEEWMTAYGFETGAGLTQIFFLRQASQQTTVTLFAAKVVNDILLAGTSKDLRRFPPKYTIGSRLGDTNREELSSSIVS